MTNTNFVITTMDNGPQAERVRSQIQRGERNLAWLAEHWADFLPQARGRFLAIAGQEGYIAESAEAAWTWAQATHSEDDGALIQ